MAKDPDFYKRMQEAKERKKKALEQKQLRDEFIVHPERFETPLGPIIVKTEAEQKLDEAFNQVKDRLHQERLAQQDKLSQALDRINKATQGI